MKHLVTLTAILLTVFSGLSQTTEQDSLTIQLAFQQENTDKVNTSILLIKSLYDSGDYAKALRYVQESEDLATKLQYDKGTAEIRYYKALIYTQREDYYNALDNYNKSLSIYSKISDSLGMAKVNNSLGEIEIKRGNYQRGLAHALSAIEIFEKRNLNPELSQAYSNLAEAYYQTGKYEEALEYNTKALDRYTFLSDLDGIKISTKNIAELYALQKEHRKAIDFYETALGLLDENQDEALRGEILPNLGEQYLLFREFDKATPYLLEGLQYNRRINNNNGIFKSLNNLANLNLQLRKIRLAENQLDEAFFISQKLDNDRELLKHFGIRKALDSTKGDFENAYKWQQRYFQLKSKIDIANVVPEVTEPAAEVKPIIDEPVKDKQASDPELLKTNKILWYVIYGISGLLLATIIFLILTLNKRGDVNRQLSFLMDKNKEYKAQNDEMVEHTQHLEEMNHVKDRLFSIVSHDLKDSITSIKAFLDLLKENSISEREFNELIPELSDNADNASALLLNLLNWSKSQMQNLEPKPELINIQDVFLEKLQLIDKKVKKKRIVLLDESIKGSVYADRSMIEIVIQNLLANAVKFSRVGDVITVSNRERNGNCLICIEDTGVGISPENQKKIFGTGGFTTRGTHDEKGTGLGLSICKQLVEMNNGKIW
ncbi:MAG: tetratricopeptide repeat-containing sensor histidine kinase, partial [Flavobacteriaceae bacterium]|nr:tetratricopeptide repeat-containing sensor histidine kinase [Flavobacteriaceae bacterium]